MAKRYVGAIEVDGNDVGLEVRAKSESIAKSYMVDLVDKAYPDAEWRDITPEVSRLKEKGGKWSPVKVGIMDRLKKATTWVTPQGVEATDLHIPESTNIVPFTPKPAQASKPSKSTTPKTSYKTLAFGFTDDVLKGMSHGLRKYDNLNEVIK